MLKVLGFVVAPDFGFARLAQHPRAGHWGVAATVLAGLGWSSLFGVLAARGHQPTGPLWLPIPREDYYLWEAVLVVPVRLGMFGVLAMILHFFAHPRTADWGPSFLVAGVATAVPSIVGWLIPDLIVYLWAGFSALGRAVRWVAPLSVGGSFALLFIGLRGVFEASRARAAAVALLGLVAYFTVGAPFLR